MVTGETAQALLEAAVDCLDGVSAAGLKVDEVARRAGVNKRMIYHHFGNKAGLVEAARDGQAAVLAGARLVSAEMRQVLMRLYPGLQPVTARPSHARLQRAARVTLARMLETRAGVDGAPSLQTLEDEQLQTFLAELGSLALLGQTFSQPADRSVSERSQTVKSANDEKKPSFRLSSVSRPKAPGAT